jgi:DNA-directed RNA polymerase specialized sigma24 family protein
MLTASDFTDLYNPERPLHTNDFAYGLRRNNQQTALKDKFIETSAKTYRNVIVLDLDHEQADWKIKTLVHEDGVIPEPNFHVVNPASGHAHIGYFISSGVGTNKGWDYMEHIRWGLTVNADADARYSNLTMRNPLHANHMAVYGTDHLYSLAELNDYLPKEGRKRQYGLSEEAQQLVNGRNDHIFHLSRSWAYRNRYKYTVQGEWYAAVEAATTRHQGELLPQLHEQLTANELRAIAKSIAKFTWKNMSPEGFIEIQTARSHKSAVKRVAAAIATEDEIVVPMIEAGFTIAEVAENMGISYTAAQKRVSKAKKRQADALLPTE